MVKEKAKKVTTKVVKSKAVSIKKKDTEVIHGQTGGILNPEVLISQAIQQNVPVETLERLLKMRQELKREFAKEQYDLAMAKLQMDMPVIKKSKQVKTKTGQIAYQYAPLESIVDQVKGILERHGFSYSVDTKTNDDKSVTSIITAKHSAGHSEISTMTLPLGTKTAIMSDTQVVASALTFAKRYAFCNVFGIMTGESDNDGQGFKRDAQPTSSEQTVSVVKPKPTTLEEMMNIIKQAVASAKDTTIAIEFDTKTQADDRWSDDFKKEIHEIAMKRVAELEEQE